MIARFGLLGVGVAIGSLTAAALAHGQIGPAPSGEPRAIADAAIKAADHPCGKVIDATRLDTGGIRAVCSNGEKYRVFVMQGHSSL
jgi:hypothetical protein